MYEELHRVMEPRKKFHKKLNANDYARPVAQAA